MTSNRALLCALPRSEGEVARGLAGPDAGFVRSNAPAARAGGGPALAAELWRKQFAAVARALERLEASARSEGVSVSPATDARALREAFEARPALLVLVAHCPTPALLRDDVREPAGFLRALERPSNSVQERVARLLGESAFGCEEELDAAIAVLGDELSRAARGERPWLTRMLLEEGFPGVFRPAPVVELSDGFITLEELAALVPTDHECVIDLALCHSLHVGEALKRRRPGVLVVVSERRVAAVAVTARVGCVFRELAAGPGGVLEAYRRVGQGGCGGAR